jgi:hypothetical protein
VDWEQRATRSLAEGRQRLEVLRPAGDTKAAQARGVFHREVKHHGGEEHQADHGADPEALHAGRDQAGFDHADDVGAEIAADDRRLAAEDRGAADEDCGHDGHEEAGSLSVEKILVFGGQQDGGEGGEQAHQRVPSGSAIVLAVKGELVRIATVFDPGRWR